MIFVITEEIFEFLYKWTDSLAPFYWFLYLKFFPFFSKRPQGYGEIYNHLISKGAWFPEHLKSTEKTSLSQVKASWSYVIRNRYRIAQAPIISLSESTLWFKEAGQEIYRQIPLAREYERVLEYVHKLNDDHLPPKEMAREVKKIGIYWKNIELFARQLVDSYKDCRYKHFLSLSPLKGVPKKIVTKNSLEIVQVDLIVANSLLKGKGFNFIFTVKDHFSRFADAKAIRDKKVKLLLKL